jgi:hypothetical protein
LSAAFVEETSVATYFIVKEFNTRTPSNWISPTTIWISEGSSDHYDETGIKIAGPMAGVVATEVADGLATFLRSCGHVVAVEDAIDD